MSIEYEEVQRLWQNRLAVLLGVLGVVAAGATSSWWVSAVPTTAGLGRLEISGLVIGASAIGVGLAFHWVRLVTRVGDGAVEVRLAPLRRRRIRLHEIELCEPVEYRPLRAYGGWGFRSPFAKGGPRAMTLAGDRGVLVTLRSGRVYLIGSLRAEALREAIERAPTIAPDEPLFEEVPKGRHGVAEGAE